MPFRPLAVALCVLVLACAPRLAEAQSEEARIIATVNGAILTSYELDQRVRLDILAAGGAPSREEVVRLRERTLNTLINELLQRQEAQRNQVELSEDAVRQAIVQIATQNGSSPNEMVAVLRARGIKPVYLRRQIEAQLAWNEAMRRAFAQSGGANIPEARIEAAVDEARRNAQHDRYELSVIRLPAAEPDARATLEEALAALRAKNASFRGLARRLSRDPSAASGGSIGALRKEQMEPALAEAVEGLEEGAIAGPLRLGDDWALVRLDALRPRGVRDPNQDVITAMAFRAPPPIDEEQRPRVEKYLGDLVAAFVSCAQAREAMERIGGSATPPSSSALGDLPAGLRQLIAETNRPRMLEPRRSEEGGYEMFAVCDRKFHGGEALDPETIRNRIIEENYVTFSQRRLRRLRAEATIVVHRDRL